MVWQRIWHPSVHSRIIISHASMQVEKLKQQSQRAGEAAAQAEQQLKDISKKGAQGSTDRYSGLTAPYHACEAVTHACRWLLPGVAALCTSHASSVPCKHAAPAATVAALYFTAHLARSFHAALSSPAYLKPPACWC